MPPDALYNQIDQSQTPDAQMNAQIAQQDPALRQIIQMIQSKGVPGLINPLLPPHPMMQPPIQAAAPSPSPGGDGGMPTRAPAAIPQSTPGFSPPEIAQNEVLPHVRADRADQVNTIQNLQNMRQAVGNQKVDASLAPVMALVDSLTGSHMSSSYEAPMTGQEFEKQKAAVDDRIQKAKGELTDADFKTLQQLGVNKYYAVQMKALSDAQKSQQRTTASANTADTKATAADNKSAQHTTDQYLKETGKISDAIAETQAAYKGVDELAAKNPIEAKAKAIQTAKGLLNGGRINIQEINMLNGSQAVSDRAKQAFQTALDGTLTPENVGYFKEFLAHVLSGKKADLEDRTLKVVKPYAEQSGKDLPTAYKKITGNDFTDQATPTTAAAAPQAPGAPAPAAQSPGVMSFDQWKASKK